MIYMIPNEQRPVVYHLMNTLLNDLWFTATTATLGAPDKSILWPRVDKRFRKWNLFWTEKKILSRLCNSEPLTRYELAKDCSLHYTQVVRAVASLYSRVAIEPDSRMPWRTGKTRITYRMTPLGKFLHFYTLCRTAIESSRFPFLLDKRERNLEPPVDSRHLLECLGDLAAYRQSEVLKELAAGILSVPDEAKKRNHVLVLFGIAFEAQDKLANPSWRSTIVNEFVYRAWLSPGDIWAYSRCMPADCRVLLTATKEELMKRVREIDVALRGRIP